MVAGLSHAETGLHNISYRTLGADTFHAKWANPCGPKGIGYASAQGEYNLTVLWSESVQSVRKTGHVYENPDTRLWPSGGYAQTEHST